MPSLSLPSDAFRLGALIVVPSLNRLVRDGESEDVEPRVMRVLTVLAETPGEVVTRAALFEAIWTDTVVNDEALTRAVSELRKALAPGASGAIETIRGTGYRLALPIVPLAPEAAPRPLASGETRAAAPRPRRARGGSLVVLALFLAGTSLLIALWAAWPRDAPEASGEASSPRVTTPAPEARLGSSDATRLDSTSPYYRPGLSELGVYYDSTTGYYFEFADKDSTGD